MQLTMLLTADYANVDRDGKVNVMGIFNQINARDFPALHPEMRVVFSFLVSTAETGERDIKLRLLAEDGEPVLEWPKTVSLPPPVPGRPSILTQILRLTGVAFPKAGEYAFHLLVNDEERGSTPIYVTQVPES